MDTKQANFPEAHETQFNVFQATDADDNQRLYFHPVYSDEDTEFVRSKIEEIGFDDEKLEEHGIIRFFPEEVNVPDK